MDTKIAIETLDLYYSEFHALKNINMRIPEKEITAFIGPSGCGKSTLLKSLNRMNDLIEGCRITGRVLLDNDDIYANDDVNLLRKRVGMVFQKPNPFPMSVYDNIAFGPRTHGVKGKAKLDDMVEEALRKAAIWGEVKDRLDKSALSFSGGQQQRLCIARALAVQPEFIVLDEPISALDVSIQAQVLNLLQNLQKEYNLTYLFISHDLSVVEMISDRIGVMYLGTIVETAPKKELYANPRHPYTRALLSAVPIPDPEVKKERITLKGDLPSPSNPPSGCLFHTRCPHCTEKCKTQVPTPVEIAPGHIVKCHYPELTE